MFIDILPKWCIKLKITVAHLCNMMGLAKADRFWQKGASPQRCYVEWYSQRKWNSRQKKNIHIAPKQNRHVVPEWYRWCFPINFPVCNCSILFGECLNGSNKHDDCCLALMIYHDGFTMIMIYRYHEKKDNFAAIMIYHDGFSIPNRTESTESTCGCQAVCKRWHRPFFRWYLHDVGSQ